jgi:hypothetical protein
MKNELVAADVQCWWRSDRSGSSAFSSPLSLILQLDELEELDLEIELELDELDN